MDDHPKSARSRMCSSRVLKVLSSYAFELGYKLFTDVQNGKSSKESFSPPGMCVSFTFSTCGQGLKTPLLTGGNTAGGAAFAQHSGSISHHTQVQVWPLPGPSIYLPSADALSCGKPSRRNQRTPV
ncbi:hypothetical protein STEG23_008815 [Scotinomys teguina]